jgi:nucleotide-binding universal stress UspA family protein
MSQILIAYDGSEASEAAIDEAAQLFPGRSATIVTVWHSIEETAKTGLLLVTQLLPPEESQKIDEKKEEQALDLAEAGSAHARSLGLDANAKALRAYDSEWKVFVDFADNIKPLVVVVGSRGFSAIKGVLMGSFSAGVSNNCKQPVLIARGPFVGPEKDGKPL